MKITAKQVNPAYQDSFDNWMVDVENGNISVFGNKDYHEHISSEVCRVLDVLRDEELADSLDDFARGEELDSYGNNTIAESINSFLPPIGKEYSASDLDKIVELVADYGWNSDKDMAVLRDLLRVVTGKEYEYQTIHGCVQGEWNYVVYDSALWNQAGIDEFEMAYWNMGSEWIVEDEDGYTFHMYLCSDDLNVLREEIYCSCASSRNDTIVIMKWAGQRVEDIYEIA